MLNRKIGHRTFNISFAEIVSVHLATVGQPELRKCSIIDLVLNLIHCSLVIPSWSDGRAHITYGVVVCGVVGLCVLYSLSERLVKSSELCVRYVWETFVRIAFVFYVGVHAHIYNVLDMCVCVYAVYRVRLAESRDTFCGSGWHDNNIRPFDKVLYGSGFWRRGCMHFDVLTRIYANIITQILNMWLTLVQRFDGSTDNRNLSAI